MRKIIVFGNSGSGKSTLSAALSESQGLAHLDLDTLAWLPSDPLQRRPLGQSELQIQQFVIDHPQWVIEGCYADLLALAAPYANEAIFMNLPIHLCQRNAKSRPWEPHKYPSKAAQDENLPMLLDWIAAYTERKDALSYRAHHEIYERFGGKKMVVRDNLPALLYSPRNSFDLRN